MGNHNISNARDSNACISICKDTIIPQKSKLIPHSSIVFVEGVFIKKICHVC